MLEIENHYQFNQYCHSKEESNSPLIPTLIKIGKNLLDVPGIKKDSITLASRYGKRLLITTKNLDLNEMKRKDFVEIIDVEPLKKIILYFGPSVPTDITAYLWMLHYAKKEIQFSVYFEFEEKKKSNESFPFVEKKGDFLDTVKNMLRAIQQTSEFQFDKNAIIITGQTIKDIENQINKKR